MKVLAAACAGAATVNTTNILNEEPDRFRALTNIGGVKDGVESSATGGHVFTMQSIREHTGDRLDHRSAPESFEAPDESSICERWAVLTSIFDPTETVRQLGEMEGWCVVVVGDKNGPAEYDAPGVTYLTPEDQEALPYRITSILPWNNFGRKNVGYLYAVHHGAKVIYDVDDDNALMRPEEGIPHAEANPEPKPLRFLGDQSAVVHNPYPCFGGPGNVWPRGFPLGAINEESSVPCSVVEEEDGETRSLGVVQSLANHDPDVDAIYRLTYPAGGLPFDFDGSPSPGEERPIRVVPDFSMTPYNAQATLHFYNAFWGMLLPVTVHGRVSDIWRSYFTQTLLPSVGGVVAFAPAWIEQIRNAHDYMADFMAELPLYQQSGALTAFLVDYRRNFDATSTTSIVERVEGLAIAMYEYGIIEEADVVLTQAWLQDLLAAGYVPPGSSQRKPEEDSVKEEPEDQILEASHKRLVIAVPSVRKERRDKIRETWLTWADDRVMLCFFCEWSKDEESNTSLKEEMEAHGDIVVLDIEPGMNFGLKLLEAMRWMSKNYSFDFFLRLDDDYFLCLPRLLEELDSTLLAIYPKPMPPIYVGWLRCQKGYTRIDEAYILLTGLLVGRILNADRLMCGGHGGTTAGYWFTKGNPGNKEGDVQWFSDSRLGVFKPSWMAKNQTGNTEPGVKNVCKDYVGIHQSYPDRIDLLWPAARDAEAQSISRGYKPLFDFMDNNCPSLVESGVSLRSLERKDHAQECNSFHTHGGIHYGAEGHH